MSKSYKKKHLPTSYLSSTASSSRKEEINIINFSFQDHKHTLNNYLISAKADGGKYISHIDDTKDFWKFVNKYEEILKSAGQPILPPILKSEKLEELQPYHKRKYICLKLDIKSESPSKHDKYSLPKHIVQQFQEIIVFYLDFKQKEKFAKIKKLRKAQCALPIARFKDDLETGLESSRVLIVAGDTGCGKSTQVPQYLYEFGYRSIACTQPRRLACVSLSKRVAHEMLEDYGQRVGFQIRFEKSKTSRTNIVFITEGLLLRQLAISENLGQYDAIILDEIHERNLFGDFLLGVAKCLLRAKPNLKLILMSATINVELFHNYFKEEGAKLIEVPGRLYPIKTLFMPPPALELKKVGNTHRTSERLDPGPFIQVLSLIDQKYPTTERGDVLIFVSGVNEITTLCDAIKEYSEQNSHWIILPLHSGLALAAQDKVFDYAPEGMRKCIVSTNIAETSLTVDGIRFVIDSGKVKEMSYDASCKAQRLKEFWVSKSSAEQRKGRAGRTGPGNCYRLFSQKQYDTFEAYPAPEIFRVPLDSILLQMISMGLHNVRAFPFIETPNEEAIEQTILTLKQHDAISNDEKITTLGTSLATLPVDLTIGKMLLMGCVFPDVEKILTLAAILSVQNPFTTRAYNDTRCEQAREPFASDQGDVFILMNAYHKWLSLKRSREKTIKWCHQLGIEEQRFYEITKLRNQFQNILENNNMAPPSSSRPLTSTERVLRHGEISMLRAIKRKQKYQQPRRRKILKHRHYRNDNDDFDDDVDNECNSMNEDMRDIEFRLHHDSRKMDILLKSANATKMRDVVLLKLIIVSGFYPQMAIADEFNYCKGGAQQFFHTKLKPFLSIHPNAYFAKYYELLKINECNIESKPAYYTPKQILSSTHQLLCYQSLLETAKPYLMNCIRLPAAQTLMLFSYTIDTNINCTSIVCDTWLCLDFPIPDTGLELLLRVCKLRRLWHKKLNDKLDDLKEHNLLEGDDAKASSSRAKRAKGEEEHELWDSLLDFMNLEVSYTIKRLLPADIKTLYSHANLPEFEKKFMTKIMINPFDQEYNMTANEEKGGYNVTEHIVYGCLQEQLWTQSMNATLESQNWLCSICNKEITSYNINKILSHKLKCCKRSDDTGDAITTKATTGYSSTSDDFGRTYNHQQQELYECSKCNKKMTPNPIDILRHEAEFHSND